MARFRTVFNPIMLPVMLLLAAALSGGQQNTGAQESGGSAVSGHVVDATTGQPLVNANVFLAQTALGASTDKQGFFRITDVPPGTYRLVVSLVGYQMWAEPMTIGAIDVVRREFRLESRLLQGEEVQVSGVSQAEWKKHLLDFTEKFIGTGDFAADCRILNPEVISFKDDSISRDLLASSQEMITVENLALGYRVDIALGMFSWDLRRDIGRFLIYPRFEPLRTARRDSLLLWDRNREESYDRSLAHFLSSLLSGRLEEEGFEVYIGPLPYLRSGSRKALAPGDITIQKTDLWGMRRILFSEWLLVLHDGRSGKQTNYIALDQGIALVDSLGNPSDPLGIHVMGPWQERRVSDMLPLFWVQQRSAR